MHAMLEAVKMEPERIDLLLVACDWLEDYDPELAIECRDALANKQPKRRSDLLWVGFDTSNGLTMNRKEWVWLLWTLPATCTDPCDLDEKWRRFFPEAKDHLVSVAFANRDAAVGALRRAVARRIQEANLFG